MPKSQTILQIFVASPCDVDEEREILEDVVREFNQTWADNHGTRLELLKWETHTRPSFGQDAQDVINKQIGNEYDIFIGIMWGRFGSPTRRAESGTEEEFLRAFNRYTESPDDIQIMFYFKDAGIPPSKQNPKQVEKVLAFKQRISSEHGGLFHEFVSVEEFQTKIRIHLSKLVQDWLKCKGNIIKEKTSKCLPVYDKNDPLSHLNAVSGDEDEGIIELSEGANDAMSLVFGVVKNMTKAITDIGDKFRQRTSEFKKLKARSSNPQIKDIKHIADKTGNDLEMFIKRLSIEIPEFQIQHTTAMDKFGQIALLSASNFNGDPDEVKEALKNIQKYISAISSARNSLSRFRDTAYGLPRTTTAFNRARKRTVAILDDLLAQLSSAERQSEDVVSLLNAIIDKAIENDK